MSGQPTPEPSSPKRIARRGPLRIVLDVFSSVRFGIVLMSILFVYCTIGSAGILLPTRGEGDLWFIVPLKHEMLRQWRVFELTEFEWFNTPAFVALIGLIAATIIVTTLRRIRFSVINLGVWMIHSGIIILCAGSILYFSTKIEGDTPVLRRRLVIEVPDAPTGMSPGVLPVLPRNEASLETPKGEYRFAIADVNPNWPLMTEGHEGKKAYSVQVLVTTPERVFVRQLLAGYPEFTEDVLPGRGRVKKLPEFEGRALLDDSIRITLEPMPQDHFWLKDTAAIYARPLGAADWSQRVIRGLPRYNDYVASPDQDVWPAPTLPGERPLRPHPLEIRVAGAADDADSDPLAGLDVRITGFLRYAVMQSGLVPGSGEGLNPMADIVVEDDTGARREERLLAHDPRTSSVLGGQVVFEWLREEKEKEAFAQPSSRRMVIRIPASGFEQTVSFTDADLSADDAPMTPLGESGFSYRLHQTVDRLPLSDGTSATLLLVDIQTPEGGRFRRWVFEDQSKTRDNPFTAIEEPHRPQMPDPRISIEYSPGRAAPIAIVAGDAGVSPSAFITDSPGATPRRIDLRIGEPAEIMPGLRLTLRNVARNAARIERPAIVHWTQRDRDADSTQLFAMVQVRISGGGRTETRWLPFHRYAFDDHSEAYITLGRYEPAVFSLADGRRIEVLVSRERRPLPAPVILDDFLLETHVGGFSGRVSSIRDWTSMLRFAESAPARAWSDPVVVSTNNPGRHGQLWFFQAFWDAPRTAMREGDVTSSGLNFTGLGVGNRRGVYIQLAGCALAVTGMLYAFYVKPVLRRRSIERVHAAAGRMTQAEREPVLVNGDAIAGGARS